MARPPASSLPLFLLEYLDPMDYIAKLTPCPDMKRPLSRPGMDASKWNDEISNGLLSPKLGERQ